MTKIILLDGPSGAGKSTTARALLDKLDGVWAYIAQDDIRDLIKVGYESANRMSEDWSDNVKNQVAVSVPLCCDMIRRYQEYGINCIVDFFAEPDVLADWFEQLEGFDYMLFVLLPDLQTTLARNQERSGTARLTDVKINFNHAQFDIKSLPQNVVVIDSSSISVDAVVQKIRQQAHV